MTEAVCGENGLMAVHVKYKLNSLVPLHCTKVSESMKNISSKDKQVSFFECINAQSPRREKSS